MIVPPDTIFEIKKALEGSRVAGANDPHSLVLRGGSCIIAPDGSFVVEPVFDEETIITAELDLSMIDKELMTLR